MRGLKSKQILQFLAILAIIVASVTLLFLPNLIEDRYPYSYSKVNEGKENVESLNRELSSNESMIENTIMQLEETEVKEEEVAEKEFNVRKGIIEEDFELHIPSILIRLEKKAIENDLDLVIDYNSMTTDEASGSSDFLPEENYQGFDESERGNELYNPTEDFDEDDFSGGQVFAQESEEQNGISITENIDENNNDDETTEQENSEHNDIQEEPDDEIDEHKYTNPAIEGINVTTIPLSISGSFYNVRNYIRFLDEVGMIEPSSVVITSEGRNVSASIIINIFHGEVN